MADDKKKIVSLKELRYYHEGLMRLLKGLFVKAQDGYGLIATDDYNAIKEHLENPGHVEEMTGASSTADGQSGTVPAPVMGDQVKFLKGDGTWSAIKVSDIADDNDKPLADVIADTVAGEVAKVSHLSLSIVAALPTEDISENIIYLVPVEGGEETNSYNEWVYLNNKWELIGNTGNAFDFEYASEDEINSLFEEEQEPENTPTPV